ncbi:corrinoid protein [Eubacterium limosum]|uniref:Corrinoid protein n=1 Tax=Eubacterium limosum TaxID=1736 RepID=A0ABT5UKT6_EUBLI|nr:corrinoid protein [Eubacterium limosum]MCB6568826.1 corrinoid protein [Eubacterium limosum]MDE1469405.1 corrinoid protein [Eubacterium limosum]
MSNYAMISDYVVSGNENGVVNEVNAALSGNAAPLEIINDGLLTGMNVVGEKFANGEMFVPEVLMAARAMNAGMDIVMPLLAEGDVTSLGTVVIGTVKGDLHDIGKNLVVMMLESAGFKVVNLGVDAKKEAFVEAAKENNADIVAMSAMLTTTMTYMDEIIKTCKDAGIDAKYMIGGAPVTPAYAEKISAIYTADASTAAEKAKALV